MHSSTTQLLLSLAGASLIFAYPQPSQSFRKYFVPEASPVPKHNPQRLNAQAKVNSPAAVTNVNDYDGVGSLGSNRVDYSGDGEADQGWPSISQWESFEDMWNNNLNNIQVGCDYFQVPRNSQDEINSIRSAIESIAGSSYVDHRLILAIVMQESNGCVRVPTTIAPDTSPPLYNPGLMQDSAGYYRCNCQSNDNYNEGCDINAPCSYDTIYGMIREGSVGTDSGEGLASLLNDAQNQGAANEQTFYVAANWYNQGESTPVGGGLSSYAVDVANRLTGWLGP